VGERKPFRRRLPVTIKQPRSRFATTGRTRAGASEVRSDRKLLRVPVGSRQGWRFAGSLRLPSRHCSRSPLSPPSPARSSSRRSSKVIPLIPPLSQRDPVCCDAPNHLDWIYTSSGSMSAVPANWFGVGLLDLWGFGVSGGFRAVLV